MWGTVHRSLRKEGRYSTAHVYQNALLSFTKFCGGYSVSFRQVTRERLRRYEQHLYECGLKPNTISTYMRMLRSVYNHGVGGGECALCPVSVSRCLYGSGRTAEKGFTYVGVA